ncbi:hypothetical protein D3C84_1121840 [compost metagenome]
MQGSNRSNSGFATSRRDGSKLPNAATKSSNTSNGTIFDSGMNRIRIGPATRAVPNPAMPNTM